MTVEKKELLLNATQRKKLKYINDRCAFKERGYTVKECFDNNYQIVVLSPSGELVDFYSTTGTFILRKSRDRGNGMSNLITTLDMMRNITYSKANEESEVLKEASPTNFIEQFAMNYLKSKGYKIFIDNKKESQND